MTADLSRTVIMTTAWRRPYYLEPVLKSWAAADGIAGVSRLVINLGPTDKYDAQMALIQRMRPRIGCPVEVMVRSPEATAAPGGHRAIMETVSHVFTDPDVDFVVCGEEDIQVSSDVLAYMAWARDKFAGDPSVLVACAHNRCGQGWDPAAEPQDGDADQRAVRLVPYYNPWGWGTWRDRWEQILEPTWDWTVTSGTATQSGYDWNIQLRVLPSGPYVNVVPDASRSQNIGQYGGIYALPEKFHETQSKSFRLTREPGGYEIVT